MRYGRDFPDRLWYGGGGLDDGDSDVEFGYSASGFGSGNRGGRSFGGYDQGRSRFTGMESNRYRGAYDSGFRAGRNGWDPSHGGYRGEGWHRGGGMNPGRRPGW